DGADQVFFTLIIFVLAIGDDARGGGDGKKCFRDADLFKGGLEICDIALELGFAGIGDRPDADRFDGGRYAFALVKLGIKLSETFAVDPAGEGVGARLDRPPLEAA